MTDTTRARVARGGLGRAAIRIAVATALAGGLGALANACSASSPEDAGSGGESGGPGSSGKGGSSSGGSGQGGTGNDDLDASGPSGSGSSGRDACAAVGAEAKTGIQPADIIIAVDTSGSMDAESDWVQQALPNFANLIIASGIDVHVIMIADASVCVPTPLGSGSCPGDEALPIYQHVVQGVDSNNGLQIILDTYPQWQPSLRAGATKTFLIVSDDDSDLSAQSFTNQLLALDPPTFQGFKFDAIIATEPSLADDPFGCITNMTPCCIFGAAEGKVHEQLVTQTGGVVGNLCLQDFNPVFMDMATAVISGSKVSCVVDIPPAPDGGTFDPNKVNVEYTPGGMGMPSKVLNVPNGPADCGAAGGWYYDDAANPTKILLCPATCDVVQGDAKAKLDVYFGCETEIQPPN